jgi:transcriptional regulator with XRE-family HTH domain
MPTAFHLTAESFGCAVRHIRHDQLRSQRELAAACGMSLRQLQRYEYGENEAGVTVLLAIAGALGVQPGEIIAHASEPCDFCDRLHAKRIAHGEATSNGRSAA